jgi:hypothetical protein
LLLPSDRHPWDEEVSFHQDPFFGCAIFGGESSLEYGIMKTKKICK